MTSINCVNTYIVPTAGYEVAMPLQPAFASRLSATIGNVTGDNTAYIIICDLEQFDQNSDYNNGTGVFTAPVTGRYVFNISISLTGIEAAHTTGYSYIITSNRSYRQCEFNYGAIMSADTTLLLNEYILADMDAADTCQFNIRAVNGNKVIDLVGVNDGNVETGFSGYLAC